MSAVQMSSLAVMEEMEAVLKSTAGWCVNVLMATWQSQTKMVTTWTLSHVKVCFLSSVYSKNTG